MSFKSIFEKYDVYKECPNCKNKSLIELEEGLFVCDNCGKEYKGSLDESSGKKKHEPTKTDIINWLADHDQAWEDICDFFGSSDLEEVDYDSIIDWIFDHDLLSDDLMSYFGAEWFVGDLDELEGEEESLEEEYRVRPSGGKFAVFKTDGNDSADILFTGTEEECYAKIDELKKKESLTEGYSAGYVKGNPYNADLIYSVSIEGPFEGKDQKYNLVNLTLIAGKDYVDSYAYDGLAWVDADQWVDEVQIDRFVWYPDVESLDDVLEYNGYEKCERPTIIWHYDEVKDDWYRDRNIEKRADAYLKDGELKESWSDASYKDYESIDKFVEENDGPRVELVRYKDGPLDTSIITVEIDGDWKHDHMYFDYLVEQWAEKNGRKIIKIDKKTIEDTGSDWYPAYHTIYISKDDESYDMLNKMRPLFANESLKEAFNADTVKKRISSYKESDNGHRLFKYYDWTSDEAEEKAKQASIKDPTDVYYVKYDDIMNPCSDVRWYKGNSYLNESLDEKLDESLTLYKGYQKSFYRWDAVDNGFRLDSNGEIDFTSDPEVAAGYGWFGLRIKVQGLKFKKVSSYSVADRESIIDEGFDGVQQHDQFYIFNVDKLNNNIIEKHAYTIAGTDIGLVINKTPNTTAPGDIKRNTLCYIKGKIFNNAWGHKIYFNDEEYVLCKTHDDSGHASVVVYSTECAELNNRTGTYCTAPLSEVMLYTNASDESLSEDTSKKDYKVAYQKAYQEILKTFPEHSKLDEAVESVMENFGFKVPKDLKESLYSPNRADNHWYYALDGSWFPGPSLYFKSDEEAEEWKEKNYDHFKSQIKEIFKDPSINAGFVLNSCTISYYKEDKKNSPYKRYAFANLDARQEVPDEIVPSLPSELQSSKISNKIFYTVYRLDSSGNEDESIKNFKNLDSAIAFAKKQHFPTHIVLVPAFDIDNYGEDAIEYIRDNFGYEPFEVVWSGDGN